MLVDFAKAEQEFIKKSTASESHHLKRYMESLRVIVPLLNENTKVLEIGDRTVFSSVLFDLCPGIWWQNTTGDLRTMTALPMKYDVVLCMEVLEHIKDQEPKGAGIESIARFNWSGLRHLVGFMYTSLKVGGTLFTSTPNVASQKNIFNLLKGEHPFFYAPHVRELSLRELRNLMHDVGWDQEDIFTIDVWKKHGLLPTTVAMIDKFSDEIGGCPKETRGDCIFGLFRK